MAPSQGSIVQYSLTSTDVSRINEQRSPARGGNHVQEGDTFPMMIVRVFGSPTEDSPVNGQVFLDGPDSLWVTSVQQGDGAGRWREPPRVYQ